MPRQNRNVGAASAAPETATAPSAGRGGRPPVDIGQVSLSPSTTPFVSRRAAPIDTNPTALALRDAPEGQPFDLTVEPGKEAANVHVLRRAAQRYNKGLRLQVAPGKVTFMTGPKRAKRANGGIVTEAATE